MQGQAEKAKRMLSREWQQANPQIFDCLVRRIRRKLQLSQRRFDRDPG